jgi:hypothetical protein
MSLTESATGLTKIQTLPHFCRKLFLHRTWLAEQQGFPKLKRKVWPKIEWLIPASTWQAQSLSSFLPLHTLVILNLDPLLQSPLKKLYTFVSLQNLLCDNSGTTAAERKEDSLSLSLSSHTHTKCAKGRELEIAAAAAVASLHWIASGVLIIRPPPPT